MTDKKSRSILIVDDEPLVIQTIAAILQKHGFTTMSASTASQSLEIIRRPGGPELVLMDIDLGAGMDGVEAAEIIIRESPVPVLFLSGHTESEYVSRTEDVSSYGFVFKDAGETVLLASVKMAFRLYDARNAAQERETALQASETRYRSLFDEAPVGYHELDLEGRVVNINQTELRMLSYERSEVIGEKIWKFIVEPESHGAVAAKLAGRLQPGKRYERTFRRKDGSTFPVYVDDVLLLDKDGNTVGIRSTLQDISRHREADQRLHESEERYRILIENASETIAVVQNGILKFANAAAEALTGYSRRELLGKPIVDFFIREDHERILINQQMHIENRKAPDRVEKVRILSRDGTSRWVEVRATVITWGGSPATLNFFVDFTDRKKIEDALALALDEKSSLLKHLQERIKNSFSLMSSLIGLEAGRATDPSAITVLGNVRDRISSLNRMYLLMDQSGDFQHIRIDTYFSHIVRSLSEKYLNGRPDIKVHERYDSLLVAARLAAPCGIILNEFITNALRFAFPGGQPGHVTVDVAGQERELVITVTDDGVGPPAGFSIEEGTGLGLRIVQLFVEQLRGHIGFTRTDRTVFTVSVPLG
jgi:PAS domain S-box-containing protein